MSRRLLTRRDIAAGSITAQPPDESGAPLGKSRESRLTMTFRKKNLSYAMPHGLGTAPVQVVVLGVGGGYDPAVPGVLVNAPLPPYFPGPRDECVTEDFIALRCPTDWTWAEILLRG